MLMMHWLGCFSVGIGAADADDAQAGLWLRVHLAKLHLGTPCGPVPVRFAVRCISADCWRTCNCNYCRSMPIRADMSLL